MMMGAIAAQEAAGVVGFAYSEHLLVWSWRRIATGRTHCPVMAREFAEVCGEDADEVFLTLRTFLNALAYTSRRPLTIGAPGCLAVTADERQVLTLVAAAQANTPVLFEAHLHWLAGSERRHILQITARALATALLVNGLGLALPVTDIPAACERNLVVV